MAAVRLGLPRLFVPQWTTICRHASNKINIKRPKTHYRRRVFQAVTQPIYQTQIHDPTEACSILQYETTKPKEEVNLYKEFLKRKCLEALEKYPTVVVYQMHSIKPNQEWLMKKTLQKKDFYLKRFEPIVVSETLAETRWRNLVPLVDPQNRYILSESPNIKELLAITKKMADLILLGGVVEGQLVSREGLARYAALPGLEAARGELCAVLGAPAGRTRSLLASHQQRLVANLAQYVKQNAEEADQS